MESLSAYKLILFILIMNLQRFFYKPEYFFRPRQLFVRLKKGLCSVKRGDQSFQILGGTFQVKESETIGKALLHFGVYDLALTEVLWRLLETGNRVADIGANIGYFSLIMGHRVGAYGRVYCFEPHPQLQKKWSQHLRRWTQCQLFPIGLSSSKGEMNLYIPQDFNKNEGVASLEKKDGAQVIKVPVQTLDELLAGTSVDLIKIDVEGHELEVFKGAAKTLETVSHILFEDFDGEKSEVVAFLRDHGFQVFRIHKGFRGVQLLDVEESGRLPLWEPPNYLATKKLEDVKKKMSIKGWKSLRYL